MQLTQVRYFIQAARLLNFTKAADVCCVSQPALTKGIKSLEEELGGPLFHRTPKLCLSDLGRRVLPFLELTFESANAVRQQALSFRKGELSLLSIAFDPSVQSAIVLPILSELNRALPGFSMRLLSMNSEAMSKALLEGEIDLGVRAHDNALDRQPMHHLPLVAERLMVVCARDHAFAQTKMLDLTALLNAPDRISFCGTIDKLLNGLGVSEPPLHRVSSSDQVQQLLDMGAGWTLLPADHPVARSFFAHELTGTEITRLVEVVYPAGRPHGAAVLAFLRLARIGKRPELVKAA